MSDLAIRVRDLGKKYHIGTQSNYDKLSDKIANVVKTPFRRAGKLLRGQLTGAAELDEEFWALKDVSFDVRRGEVVGIVGHNGAGKSTLLKLLSRITGPTTGTADIYGRVGSLLEVGTGFHPELTGRENVYLNGAILGMKKVDIERKFDEIVAFADVTKFLDTPVKHYSSGMYVRLAFAVAANLEPDILLVDEILAVGDTEFQKKCLGKMENVAREGRTVLFISHNIGLVQNFSTRGMMLHEGHLVENGDINVVVSNYLEKLRKQSKLDLTHRTDRQGKGLTRLVSAAVFNGREDAGGVLSMGEPARFEFDVDKPVNGMACNFHIYDSMGRPVTTFRSVSSSPEDRISATETTKFVCELDELLLAPGSYRIDVVIRGNSDLQDRLEGAVSFDVAGGQLHGRTIRDVRGFSVVMPHRWELPKN